MQMDIRPYDAVCRYGGEEFLILLPGCIGSDTREKAERLREAICREPIATAAGILKVTMCIGGVATADRPEDTPNQLLQMADSTLYRAKEEGRNRTVMAGAAEHEEAYQPYLELSSTGSKKE
jgi:two-component system cell cycle response regulator